MTEINKEVEIQFKHIADQLNDIKQILTDMREDHKKLDVKVDGIDKDRISCRKDVVTLLDDKKTMKPFVKSMADETALWRWMQRKPSRLFLFIILENLAGLVFIYKFIIK